MPIKKTPAPDLRRYSARASITLWIVFAAFIWVTIGVIYSLAGSYGDNTVEAKAGHLSTIAPAAGPPAENPAPFGSAPQGPSH
jgi:hypothetical protein